jgi:hypothetical protein
VRESGRARASERARERESEREREREKERAREREIEREREGGREGGIELLQRTSKFKVQSSPKENRFSTSIYVSRKYIYVCMYVCISIYIYI